MEQEIEIEKLLKKWFDKSILESSFIDLSDHRSFSEIIKMFKADYKRYFNEEKIDIGKIQLRLELAGIFLYRLARYYYTNGREEWAVQYSNLGRLLSGFEIYYSAEIGEGLKINHGLGTVIGARCVIGKNALIHQNVTLGDKAGKRPNLGDNVTVYAGAVILGGIVIHDHAVIAANAVCMQDVPADMIAAGVPAKIKTKK